MLYTMKIVFALDVSSKKLNDIMPANQKPVCSNAIECAIEQTVPFIPTEEILNKYANTIKESYATKPHMQIENVRFLRYDYLYEIDDHTMSAQRAKQIAFCLIQLIRKMEERTGHDPNDTDDWLFSELDIEKGELLEIFKPYNIPVYTASCFSDGESPKNFDREYFS